MICESNRITIIQGDSAEVTFSLSNLQDDIIEEAYFTCAELNIKEALIQIPNVLSTWQLALTPDETKNLAAGSYDYDLTLIFRDGNVFTPVYKAGLVILEKVNKVYAR